MKRIAVYYRVSTKKQETDIQERAFREWLSSLPDQPLVSVFRDKKSGNAKIRPNFEAMLQQCRAGKIDTVVVYSIDRFSRNKVTGLETVMELTRLNVHFHSLTQPFLCTKDGMPFQNVLLAAFTEIAQIERETIVKRVKAGMANARAKGKVLGQPTRLTRSMHVSIRSMRSEGASIRKIAEHFKTGHFLIQRALKHQVDNDIQYATSI